MKTFSDTNFSESARMSFIKFVSRLAIILFQQTKTSGFSPQANFKKISKGAQENAIDTFPVNVANEGKKLLPACNNHELQTVTH